MHNQFKTQKFKHLMLAMGPRDLNSAPYSPVHCSSHSMTSFQSSELTELPVVENSQLFTQRAHSARYAPIEPTCHEKTSFAKGSGKDSTSTPECVVANNNSNPLGFERVDHAKLACGAGEARAACLASLWSVRAFAGCGVGCARPPAHARLPAPLPRSSF